MVKRCLLVLALVAAHGAAAVAAPLNPQNKSRGVLAWQSRAAAVLAARADANSLATAAALRFTSIHLTPEPLAAQPSALDLAARAAELAPQNAAIGWLRLRICADTPGCAIRETATIMRWVDADNAAVWLPTLTVAQRDRDVMETDRILGEMARASHFDFYVNEVVVMMFDALSAARGDFAGGAEVSIPVRFTTVSAIAAAELIPPFAPLADACRESLTAAERRDPCMKLAKIMQHSDSIAGQLEGFGIERRLLVPESRDARVLADRRHLLEWRIASAGKFDSPLLPWTKNARVRVRLALMRAMPREEDVAIAVLRKQKIPSEPPVAPLMENNPAVRSGPRVKSTECVPSRDAMFRSEMRRILKMACPLGFLAEPRVRPAPVLRCNVHDAPRSRSPPDRAN